MIGARLHLKAFASVAILAGFVTSNPPANIEPIETGDGYQAQYRSFLPLKKGETPFLQSVAMNASKCAPPRGGAAGKGGGLAANLAGERLSRNDLVDIRVEEDETFTGKYVVSNDGTLKLPFVAPVIAQGRSVEAIENDIARALVADGLYDTAPRVSVRVTDLAGITVGVSGAVFEEHAISVGGTPGDRVDTARQSALGAGGDGRDLSGALRNAGGIRPDADLSAIELYRGGKKYLIDMRGFMDGRNVNDVMLIADDEIVVPSRQCFQEDLMRPSPISPPGVSVFISNLIVPPGGNAGGSVNKDTRGIPYGTRLSQAMVNANCVGGVKSVSAPRSVILLARNPQTNGSIAIERSIEDLLRRPDRDDHDPYLLPGDSVACYDSTVTSLTQLSSALGIIGTTILLMK